MLTYDDPRSLLFGGTSSRRGQGIRVRYAAVVEAPVMTSEPQISWLPTGPLLELTPEALADWRRTSLGEPLSDGSFSIPDGLGFLGAGARDWQADFGDCQLIAETQADDGIRLIMRDAQAARVYIHQERSELLRQLGRAINAGQGVLFDHHDQITLDSTAYDMASAYVKIKTGLWMISATRPTKSAGQADRPLIAAHSLPEIALSSLQAWLQAPRS